MKYFLLILTFFYAAESIAFGFVSDRQKQVITMCADYIRDVRNKKCPKHIWGSYQDTSTLYSTEFMINPDPRCSVKLEACKDLLNTFVSGYSVNEICGVLSCRDPYVYDACKLMTFDVGNPEDFKDPRYSNVFAGTLWADVGTTRFCMKNDTMSAKGSTYKKLFDEGKLKNVAHELLSKKELDAREKAHKELVEEYSKRNPKYEIYTQSIIDAVREKVEIFTIETLPRFLGDFARAVATNIGTFVQMSNLTLDGEYAIDYKIKEGMVKAINSFGKGHTFTGPAGLIDFWFTIRPKTARQVIVDNMIREEMERRREELKEFGLVEGDNPIGLIHLNKDGTLKKE